MNRFPRRQVAGMTLVELMVALAVSLVVVLAAAASLLAARQGFTTMDTATQLRENGRLAMDMIQRIAVQAGYEDITQGSQKAGVAAFGATVDPDVSGFNNALFTGSTTSTVLTTQARSACTAAQGAGTICRNGSDVLVIRYHGSDHYDGTTADGSIINCAGVAEHHDPDPTKRPYSIFHVQLSNGEPTLMCSYMKEDKSGWVTEPLVAGVESFQVLYGVHQSSTKDDTANQYLRADQITTPADWAKVRTLKIGLLLRGDASTRVDYASTNTFHQEGSKFYPLGRSAQTANDAGTELTVADNRLRQVVNFTVQLRNSQRAY
jgi:type IV pilus assembly protein PilW